MASPKIKFKRSAVASKRPSLGSLELGELALNTYDGKLFTRRDTSGVGIATTVSTINPWTENYGSSAISYGGNISVTGVSTFTGKANFGLVSIANTVSIGDTLYSDDIRVGGDLRLNATGSQFFAFNEDTVKVKFANWYSSNDHQYGMGMLYYETFFAATEDTDSGNDRKRRFGWYLEKPDNGASDSDGSATTQGQNDRMHLDRNGLFVRNNLEVNTNLNVTGVSTTGNIELNGNTIENTNAGGSLVLAAKANLQLRVNSASSNLAMVGNSGGSVDLYHNNTKKFETTASGIDVTGHTETDTLNVTGITTISSLGAVNSVCVVGTGKSITTSEAMTLDVANKRIGIGTANPEVKLHMVGNAAQESQFRMEQYNDTADAPDVRIYRGRGTQASPSDVQTGDYLFRLNVHGRDGGSDPIYHSLQMDVDGTEQAAGVVQFRTRDSSSNEATRFAILSNGAIRFNGAYTFPTSDGNADQVLVSDGSGTLSFADQSGVSTSNVSANTLVVSGFSTFAGASFSGNVSIAGTLTYDDVTNVDSIGIITAQNGVRISSGGLSVSGVSTLSGNVNLSGDITSNVTIVSTDAGSSAAPEFKLYRNSASPADADYLGQIKFAGESDTGVERNYAKITGKILDASNGTEDGIIEFAHIKNGSQNISARFRSDSLQLINGTNLTVAGTLDVTGTTTLGVVTSVTSIEATTYYGDGSELTNVDAATLDGIDSTSFLRSDVATTKTSGDLVINDGVDFRFGTGSDLNIGHNGSSSNINQTGTGPLLISNFVDDSYISIRSDNGSGGIADYFRADGSTGEAMLYHYGTEKLATKSNGIAVSGIVTASSGIVTYYGDGSQLTGISAGAASTSNVSSNTTVSGIITASDQFYPPTLTTSERDALTVTQGALIFNTTENKVQMYLGSEWKSLAFELDTYTAVGL